MICRDMLPQTRTELRQAVETAFEDISSRIPEHDPFVFLNPPLRIEAVQLFIISEKVSREAFNVPNPADGLIHSNFFCHRAWNNHSGFL